MTFQELLDRLRELDRLLDADPRFPSITGLVTGASVRGSWWAHPRAHKMFRLACELRGHRDVLMVKLISGKVTLVHRPLWPAIFAIATARESWQMSGLSKAAKALLKKVNQRTHTDASGDPVRELESRLLVHSESVHTERGFHTKQLQRWESWADSVKLRARKLAPAVARSQIEQVVGRLNKQFGANGTLPWIKRTSRRKEA